jgi:hypothetical protein
MYPKIAANMTYGMIIQAFNCEIVRSWVAGMFRNSSTVFGIAD